MKTRIRSIKPEVHLDEQLWDLEVETGFPIFRAFTALWGCADREGRFEWRPRSLKQLCLPYWDGDFAGVLDALMAAGFIVRYVVDGRHYGLVRTFKSHQVINQREAQSTIPGPPDDASHADDVHAQESHMHARVPANITEPVRETVFARDGFSCVRCASADDLTVDHIFPRSIGGTHAITNLRTLCRACNSARPVHGQGLISDLARDGLTLDDMPRLCMHVHARGEGKGREQKGREGKDASRDATQPTPPPEVDFRSEHQDRAGLIALVRTAFEQAYLTHLACPPSWGASQAKALETLARWLEATSEARHVPAGTLIPPLVAGFFANTRAASSRWPITWLANNPAEYFAPAPTNGSAPSPSAATPVLLDPAAVAEDAADKARWPVLLEELNEAITNGDRERRDALYAEKQAIGERSRARKREAAARARGAN